MSDTENIQEAEVTETVTPQEVQEVPETTQEETSHELTVEESSSAIAQTMNKEITPQERLALIQRTVLKDFTPAEISLTVQRAQALWANILAWEMWAYKDHKWNLVNILSHKFLIDRLLKNPMVSSMQSWVIYAKDDYVADLSQWQLSHKNPHWMDLVKRWAIVWGWCIIWQSDGKPYMVEAFAKDYDKWAMMWKSHKHAMMQKTVEGIAARRFVNTGWSFLAEWEFTPTEQVPKKITKPDLTQFQK